MSFRPITLEPGAKREEQTVALGPPDGEQLRAGAGETVAVRLVLTRGRWRKLKATIEPERDWSPSRAPPIMEAAIAAA